MADNFESIFIQLKTFLQKYESQLHLLVDAEDSYSLNGPFSENWGKDLHFGAVMIKKNYVSYHLMPVYMYPDLLDSISVKLKKRMQGKSCFNFSKLDDTLFEELAELTEKAFVRFQKENV